MIRNLINSALIILLSFNIGFGQNEWKPGYIIKNQGDTIYGFIDTRNSKSNSTKCYFRQVETGETQIFAPQELFGYRIIDGKFFISKSIAGVELEKPLFLEFLIKGKVNVYHVADESDRYFIEKDSVFHELKNTKELISIDDLSYMKEKKEYLGVLGFLLKDANIQSDIWRSKLKAQSLISIAKEYHEKVCTDEKCVIYEMNVKPIHIIWGIHTGLTLNKINFGDFITSNYSGGSILGCRLEFENVLDWAENTSFVLDFTFQRLTNCKLSAIENNNSQIEYNNKGYALTNDITYVSYSILTGRKDINVQNLKVNLKAIALKIPLSIKYTFSKGNIRPYIGVGFVNMFILSQNKDFIYSVFYDEYNQSIPTYHLGFSGAFGSKLMFKNEQSVYLELNYEYTESMNENQFLRFKNNLYSINLGYAF